MCVCGGGEKPTGNSLGVLVSSMGQGLRGSPGLANQLIETQYGACLLALWRKA